MDDWNEEERRINNRLHEDDIALIVSGISTSLSDHYCRFSSIKADDMYEVIPFIVKFKRLSEKIGSIILVVVVTAITGGCIALMSLGFWGKRG
jgi:hypothetical protein